MRISLCRNKDCDGVIKPDVILFGEHLDKSVFDCEKGQFSPEVKEVLNKCDLLIVMGTSLQVSKALNTKLFFYLNA